MPTVIRVAGFSTGQRETFRARESLAASFDYAYDYESESELRTAGSAENIFAGSETVALVLVFSGNVMEDPTALTYTLF